MARKAPNRMLMMVAGAIAVLAIAGFGAFEVMSARREAAATAALWTVQGETCPTASHASPPARSTVYEGTTFSRVRSGGANCNTIETEAGPTPVCMFITPGQMRVTTTAGTFDYDPGAGRSITVYVRGGRPECVMGVNQALFGNG